jgi:hypothetical protein
VQAIKSLRENSICHLIFDLRRETREYVSI